MPDLGHTIVIALARSGYHGIVQWIGENYPSATLFHNNVNQYLWPRRVQYFGSSAVHHSLYSLENFDINGYEETFGHMPFDKIVLVMRDPYNWLASSLAKGGNLAKVEETFEPSELPYNKYFCQSMSRLGMYKEYMREIEGETNLLPDNMEFINYNKWFASGRYRIELSKRLGMPPTESLPGIVPNYGGGSSFSGMDKRKNPEDLGVLTRWDRFKDNDYYWSLLDDDMHRWGSKYFNIDLR